MKPEEWHETKATVSNTAFITNIILIVLVVGFLIAACVWG